MNYSPDLQTYVGTQLPLLFLEVIRIDFSGG